jgi:hypothetical protein
MKETHNEEFNPIQNAKDYHKAEMIKLIVNGMETNISNIFDEIENVYTSGEQISQQDLNELIKEIRKDMEALEIYLN